MKQSSIDFLLDKLGDVIGDMNTTNEQDLMLMKIIKQAKAIHKEETINTFKNAQILMVMDSSKTAESYYSKTFNTKEK
jgi:hypothetical protein